VGSQKRKKTNRDPGKEKRKDTTKGDDAKASIKQGSSHWNIKREGGKKDFTNAFPTRKLLNQRSWVNPRKRQEDAKSCRGI